MKISFMVKVSTTIGNLFKIKIFKENYAFSKVCVF